MYFNDVLEDINAFIENYDTEFLIVSIKEDNDPKNSTQDFTDKVLNDLSKYPNVVFDKLPETVKEARGKIYILNRFCSQDIGISAYDNWLDSTSFVLNNLYVQDNYSIDSIEHKIDDIQKTFELSKINNDYLYLNFTSCYLTNAFPPLYAGKPAHKINKWLVEYLMENSVSGVIIMDFVTQELVTKICEVNYEKDK